MRKLDISHGAAKDWAALPPKIYKQIGRTVLGLLSNPTPHDSQPLHGATKGERRVDSGEYRVIYAARDDAIEILVIGKRNDGDVYKQWERIR